MTKKKAAPGGKGRKESGVVSDAAPETGVPTPNPEEKDVMDEEEARALLEGRGRIHSEDLGDVWAVTLGLDPARAMPGVIAQVVAEGGTRPSWRWEIGGAEHILMAWPSDQPIRAAVLMRAVEKDGEIRPVNAFPLLEGLPNDLTVEAVQPLLEGRSANVAVTMMEGRNPMWFHDPFHLRDRNDLTPGVTHTFVLAGLALGMRRALLDDITITQGPEFEAHAERWLEEHPGSSRLDVPPYRISVRGRRIVMPGRHFAEYQIRGAVEEVRDFALNQMPVKMVRLSFPFESRPDLQLPVYASKMALGNYEPAVGDEIDAYVWLQGRVIDFDPAEEDPGNRETAADGQEGQ